MTTHLQKPPDWCGIISKPATLPETGECTLAPSLPSGTSPITWPRRTSSPTFTTGTQGAPMCWLSGTFSVSPGSSGIIARSFCGDLL